MSEAWTGPTAKPGGEKHSNNEETDDTYIIPIVGLAFTPLVRAHALPYDERQKIETLIKQVAALTDATFFRNGTGYNATTTVTF